MIRSQGTIDEMAQHVARQDMITVRGVQVPAHMRLRLLFSDGLVRDLDLTPMLTGPAFERHRQDPPFFARARIRRGTVTWPDDSDLDPLVLHGDATPSRGAGPRLLGETRPLIAAAS
jgi:hypothetical protein